MSIEAMKQALEALEKVLGKWQKCEEAITSLRQAIEQAEKQEPVVRWTFAWAMPCGWGDLLVDDLPDGTLLYTTPQPQREWVGLTDEERDECLGNYITAEGRARAIEAKLKEKNHAT